MAVSAVWRLVYLLATLAIGTKGADRSTQAVPFGSARRAVPPFKKIQMHCFWKWVGSLIDFPAALFESSAMGMCVKSTLGLRSLFT